MEGLTCKHTSTWLESKTMQIHRAPSPSQGHSSLCPSKQAKESHATSMQCPFTKPINSSSCTPTTFHYIPPPMESVASSSSSPPDRQQRPRFRFITDRITRALRHRLRLLHRSESTFFILGATGNVYTVTLSATPSCTCPDRIVPCKHILFVLIRVLGVSLEDECLRRRTLRPRQLSRLLSNPTSPESIAGATVRERFHQLFFQMEEAIRRRREEGGGGVPARVEIEEGIVCPVCLDELTAAEKVVACGTCRNPIHEECWLTWKRSSRRRRSATCVICRARWRSRGDQEGGGYLNLSVYVSEEDDTAEGSGTTTANLCVD